MKTRALALLAALATMPFAAAGEEDAPRDELVRLAMDELHRERFEDALAKAAELRRRFPADPAGPLTEANVYQTMMRDYRLRDHEPEFMQALAEARQLADEGVRSHPDAEAFFARATARGYIAIHDYRCGRFLPALAHGLRCLGDMNQAARLDPDFVDPQLALALHDYWKGRKLGILFGDRRGGAIARMETVWKQGRYLSVEAAYGLTAVLQLEGALEHALEVSNWLHARFPDNPANLYHRARILEGLERPAEALSLWDRLVERLLASGRVSHGFLAECHLRRARLLMLTAGTSSQEDAKSALSLARQHARERDPQIEMEGPLEGFEKLQEQIARLEGSLAKPIAAASR
jgi:tetratricopeptide (TPR) repeat protein